MKERPILFTGEMVRAILDGRKTQFRRPVKPQPPSKIKYPPEGRDGWFCSAVLGAKDYGCGLEWTVGACWGSQPCPQRWLHLLPRLNPPLGTVGDRLWVRETWASVDWCDGSAPRDFGSAVWYQADGSGPHAAGAFPYKTDKRGKWRPSIHMPRWASRIDLEITAVRVERVQDITEEDARAEGVIPDDYEGCEHPDNPTLSCAAHRYSFRDLWQSIYGTRPSLPKNKRSKRYERVKRWLDRNPAMDWDANPWVWVYEFRRIKP